MKVLAYDMRPIEADIPIEINGVQVHVEKVKTCDLQEVLKTSDMISLHVPKQADGSAVIGAAEMEAKALRNLIALPVENPNWWPRPRSVAIPP